MKARRERETNNHKEGKKSERSEQKYTHTHTMKK